MRIVPDAPAILLVAMLALSGCLRNDGSAPQEEQIREPETFKNPVYDGNFPDPFVIESDSTYYAYSTNEAGTNVPMLSSEDLVNWKKGEDAMPDLASWVTPGKTWAPEVLRREDGRYVLYYTAASATEGRQCIGHAVSGSPQGPFVDRDEEPFVCQRGQGGSIDASPFVDDGGATYLLWKNDGNAVGLDTYIYARRLSSDGMKLVGESARLIKQGAAWEGNLVEAPVMWEQDGRNFLFYSANRYDSEDYAVGYATCDGPLGSCEKATENPILETEDGAAGPGHVAVIEDGGGDAWVAYHAWPPDAVGSVIPGRTLRLNRLVWKGGKPVVEGPTPGRQAVPVPR